MAHGFRDLHEDLQLHILLFADLETLNRVKATCSTLCRLGKAMLGKYDWIPRLAPYALARG